MNTIIVFNYIYRNIIVASHYLEDIPTESTIALVRNDMLKDFLLPYNQASSITQTCWSYYNKIMTRVFISYGTSIGLLFGLLYLALDKRPIPLSFALLQGLTFIYGTAMLCISSSFRKNVITPSETQKFECWSDLCELDFLPVKKND